MVTKKLLISGQLFSITMREVASGEYKAELQDEHGIKTCTMRLIHWDPVSSFISFELNNKRYHARLVVSTDQSPALYFFNQKKLFTIDYPAKKVEATSTFIGSQRVVPKHEEQLPLHNVLKSPLGGRVVKVLVQPGELVRVNQPLVIIESMKMENELCSPYDAIIKTLSVVQGNLVQPNQLLITFEKNLL